MIRLTSGITGEGLKKILKIAKPKPIKVNHKKDYLNPNWKSLRAKVLKRDRYKCLNCGAGKELHCHHNYYVKGHLLWEYPLSAFQTLCKDCHNAFHKITKGSEMVRESINSKKIFKPKVKPKKKPSKHVKLKREENKFLKRFNK